MTDWLSRAAQAEIDRTQRYSGMQAVLDNAIAQGLIVHVATRRTCAEHLENGDDKRTEPLTASDFAVAPPPLDVERLGFDALLDIGQAILDRAYPPHPLLCSHDPQADVGARTTAAIADLIASCRLSRPDSGEPQ